MFLEQGSSDLSLMEQGCQATGQGANLLSLCLGLDMAELSAQE